MLGTLVSLGCNDAAMPGRMLGTFKVTGQPKTNTCGLGAPDPWTFDVGLSIQSSTLYWDWLDGRPLLSGSLANARATLTDTQMVNADSTDAGLGPCTLQSSANLDLTLGSGSSPSSFDGTVTYAYTPVAGATCADVLVASGGMYSTLPCSLTYTVTAAKQ